MAERVKAWYWNARQRKVGPKGSFPESILFYRHGASESQYGMVRHEELPQIAEGCRKALDELKVEDKKNLQGFKPQSPKLTLIVAGKRHHARFYPGGKSDQKEGNLPGGTVADTKVVTPNHYSFYLQSHHSPKGTARSAHYIVIYDDRGYSCTELEKIVSAD